MSTIVLTIIGILLRAAADLMIVFDGEPPRPASRPLSPKNHHEHLRRRR